MRLRLALKMAILASGKTQRQLAVDLGLSEVRLSGLVRGVIKPSVEEQRLLSGALGVPIIPLFEVTHHGSAHL